MKPLLPVAVVLACILAVAGALTFDVTETATQQAATIGWALVAADGDAVVGSPTADHLLLAMLRERYRLDAPPDVDETTSLLQRQSRKLQQFGGFGGLGGLGGFGGGKRPPSPPSPPPSPPDPPSPPPPSPTPPAPPAPSCDCEVFNNQVFIEYEDFINHPTLVDTIYGSDTDSYITQQDCCQLCRKTWGCKWWTLLLDDSNNNGECRLAGDFPEDQTLVFYNPWREASWLSAGYRWESRDTGLYTCVGSRANPASPPPPAGPPAPPTPPMPPNPPPAPKPPPAPPPSPTPPPRPPQPAARKPPIPRHPPSPNPPPSPSPRPPPPSPPDGSRPDVLTEGVTALSGSACSGCGDSGDLGCAGLLGAPRVQPLNDYRLVFMVKKGLDQYLANNNVYAVCGRDYRLYASPLIKFQKACYQLVSGNQWFLSVRIAYPCFGEARKINGRIVGYQAYGRWRTHNLYVRIVQLAPQYGVPQPYEVYEVYRY